MSLLLSVSKHMTLLNTKVTDLFGRLVHKRRFFFLLGSLSTLLLSSTLFLPTLKSTLLHSRIVKSLLMRRKAFTRSLYKIELHCHLTGSIRIETLNEFLREHGLQKYEPPKSLTLKNCFSAFPLVHSAIKTKENLRRLTFETLADLSYANCIYAEIRTTPRALNDINKAGYLETVIECFKEWEEGDSRLIPRLIVSVDRSKSLREAEENVDLAVEGFLSPTNKYIVGVDLGGNPSSGNFKSFIPVLNKARENGLKVTVHCGEVENEEEIDGVLEWGPDRLGHFLTCSDEQFQKAVEMEIPIEVCPTSNMLTLDLPLNVKSLKDNHGTLQKCMESNHSFSVSTDDSGLFSTHAVRELWLVAQAYELDEWRIAGIVWDMVDQVFEGNRKTRAYLARDVRVRIKNMLKVLENGEK